MPITAGSKFLLDTHVWLDLARGPKKLSNAVQKKLVRAARDDRLVVSAVSVLETVMLAERGSITLLPTPREWAAAALRLTAASLAVIDFDIAAEAGRLTAMHGDPADRLLAATAIVHRFTLVTADHALLT